MIRTNSSQQFPAGKYWIGDLCYVITSDGDWNKVCNMTINDRGDCIDGTFPWKGKYIWLARTAHGDGSYYDQNRNEYGVDAGLLGIIPVDLADPEGIDLGSVMEFTKPFECSYDDGRFQFGTFHNERVCVDTDPPFEEDDDSEDEYEDEDYDDED